MTRKEGQNSVRWTDTGHTSIDFTRNDTKYHLKYGIYDGRVFADLTPDNDQISEYIIACLECNPEPLRKNQLE